MRQQTCRRGLWVLALTATALAASARAAKPPDKGVRLDDAAFRPGEEVRIDDDAIGGLGYYLIYVPTDYTPQKQWPIALCYHGVDGNPTTWPFKQATGGKGLVIVGMEYAKRGLEGYDSIGKDVATVKRLLPILVKRLSADNRQMFIGGFSKGGFMVSAIGGRTPTLWTGMLIMGAGRHGTTGTRGFSGKAVYVGVGETDGNRSSAEKAAAAYRQAGARVTLEIYKGKGHAVDAKSEMMRDFFLANTVYREVEPLVAQAEALAKRQRVGQAYAAYRKAAAVSETFGPCLKAAEAADALAKRFEEGAAEAERLTDQGQYPRAATILRRLAREFAGCDLAEKAKRLIPELAERARQQGN